MWHTVGRSGEQGSAHPRGSCHQPVFIGKHDRSLDDKGRLVLPTSYRRPFEDAGGGVLAPWDRCLGLWPQDMFGDVMLKLQSKVEEGEAEADVARLFQSAASEVQLDGQGRFVVPAEHREHAGIDREIKVIGHNNRVEIWDASRFTAMQGGKS